MLLLVLLLLFKSIISNFFVVGNENNHKKSHFHLKNHLKKTKPSLYINILIQTKKVQVYIGKKNIKFNIYLYF